MTEPPVRQRSIVYIDGFNLYYGSVKDTPYKWLNLERLFTMLRKDDDIQAIRYFTAMIVGPRQANQQTYLNALATLPRVEVILGLFKPQTKKCHHTGCTLPQPRLFTTYEEKRTDVNIGLHMLDDAYADLCDRLILVTGDSDLVPAIYMVKSRFPKKQVTVYVPARDLTRGAATEIRGAADKDKTLPNEMIERSQFPANIPDGHGGMIQKPADW